MSGLYARAQPVEWLYLAIRGDRLWEERAISPSGESDPIFTPASNVTSFTATLDVRPVKTLSTRVEFRRDVASSEIFYRGAVQGDGLDASPFQANARNQNTVLLGATGWFE